MLLPIGHFPCCIFFNCIIYTILHESFILLTNVRIVCTISVLHILQPQIHFTGLLKHVSLRYTARTVSYSIFSVTRQ